MLFAPQSLVTTVPVGWHNHSPENVIVGALSNNRQEPLTRYPSKIGSELSKRNNAGAAELNRSKGTLGSTEINSGQKESGSSNSYGEL